MWTWVVAGTGTDPLVFLLQTHPVRGYLQVCAKCTKGTYHWRDPKGFKVCKTDSQVIPVWSA